MTTLSDPRSERLGGSDQTLTTEETPVKPPPIMVVGPLAWIRDNLFSSVTDTIITLVSLGVIVSVTTSLLNFILFQANWLVITANLRLFTVGRLEAAAEWRVQLLVLIIAFVFGFALAAWARINRTLLTFIVVMLALMLVIPPVARATLPLPESYVAAGEAEIAAGSSTERAQPQLAFIAEAGETVTVQLADQVASNDAALSDLSSFSDVATNLVRGAATNRLAAEARIAELERLLAEDETNGPILTDAQREAYTEELEDLEVGPPVVDQFNLNQSPVEVRIWRGTTGETLAETTLEAGGDRLSVTLPDDGWYVIDKTVTDPDSLAVLEVNGVYPLLERTFSRTAEVDESGAIITQGGSFSEFARLTDTFTTGEDRPQTADGDDIPMAIIIDNQYRGSSNLADYFRLYLTPFLDLINIPFLLIFGLAAVGYVGARLVDRQLSPAEQPHKFSRRTATWLLAAVPLLMFVLAYGVPGLLPLTDTRRWGGLLLTVMLTVVGIIASFPLGVALALGRRSDLPVISTASTLYIEFVRGVPLITVLFMAQLLVPLINPSLAEIPNVFRAMIGIILFSAAYLAENVRGGLQSVPYGQEEAAKAVGMAGWQIIMFITLPQALRAVIPALVGQFISLFKDTTLVAIVGLFDLLGIAETVVAQTEFLGLRRETFIFITLIFFVFSYAMGYISRRLEESGSGAARRV